MINVHRLFALSSTAVIVAACGGGGGSAPAAPRPAASAAGTTPTLTAHAANTTLTLTFPKNYVRFKNVRTPNALRHKKAVNAARRSAKTSIAKRGTKFIDPSSGTELQIEVTNYNSSNGATSSYMAAVNVPIVDSQSNTQSIPIYLAPGSDTILVQETYIGYGNIEEYAGYLLAQGVTNAYVSEGSAVTNNLTMDMVIGYPIVTTDPTSEGAASTMGTQSNPTYVTLCLNVEDNENTVYFVPADGLYGAYDAHDLYSSNPGNVSPTSGAIPFASVTVVPSAISISPASTSTAVENQFGGYTVNFDQYENPITFAVTYSALNEVQNAGNYGPLSSIETGKAPFLTEISASTQTYYALIAADDTFYCE